MYVCVCVCACVCVCVSVAVAVSNMEEKFMMTVYMYLNPLQFGGNTTIYQRPILILLSFKFVSDLKISHSLVAKRMAPHAWLYAP